VSRLWTTLERLEPREKLLIAIAAPIVVLGGYFATILGPRLARTVELRARSEALERGREQRTAVAASAPARQEEVDALDERLRAALRRLPNEKEIPQLLSAISSLGRAVGLDILVFRLKPEAAQDFYAEVPVEMQMRGTYGQVAEFFARVGHLDRIVNVSDVTLRDPKVVGDRLVLAASARVTTFRSLSEAERRERRDEAMRGEATR
jgi:type IV pilus assembly protein PilO